MSDPDSMWVVIECPAGTEVYRRELGMDEVMDTVQFADMYADSLGVSLDLSGGIVPNCCGDVRVEFRSDPDNAVCIWAGESFYFNAEEDQS